MQLIYASDGSVYDGGDLYDSGYTSLGQMKAAIARRAVLVGRIMDIRVTVSEANCMIVCDDPSDFGEGDAPCGNGDGTRHVPLSDGNLWVFTEGGRDLSDFWQRVNPRDGLTL